MDKKQTIIDNAFKLLKEKYKGYRISYNKEITKDWTYKIVEFWKYNLLIKTHYVEYMNKEMLYFKLLDHDEWKD